MELRILGPLEVLDDDGAPVDVGGSRPRALLVDLALAQGHAVPADQLLDDIWGGENAPARNNLQVHVSRLRRALGDERIATGGGGYALELPSEALDVVRFDRLAAAGRAALHAGDAERAAVDLRSALELWRGAPLVDFADQAFARPVITRLEESRVATVEDRIDADLMLGRHGELVGELEALVQEHPLREHLWAQLITALYRAGRQSDALRAYQRVRSVLAEELGIDPGPELKRLEEAVLAQAATLAAPTEPAVERNAPARSTNLPEETTTLVGRATEIDAATALVRRHRVATIVGAGGVGKTRLATAVGRDLLPEFDDGVFIADFAPVDAGGVALAIAAALGVEAEVGAGASTNTIDRLYDFLRDRRLLLILDNCEHVVRPAAHIVEDLAGHCRELRILTTSREPLMIAGEVLWPLAPLEVDDAMTLFMQRASAVVPAFGPTEAPPAIVRSLCDRLDCLPLAIELAAARMRAFTPQELVNRLDDRFRLLTSGARTAFPRQQTLRAVIDWSYDLLFDDERRVFERMSMFAGQFDLSAAEEVCADDGIRGDDVAELLARLVDKSLVTVLKTNGRVRYRLLQTLAQYGREQLAASGDTEPTRARHARYVAGLVDMPDAAYGTLDADWFGSVGESLADICVAMDWAISAGDADIACSIVGGLGWYWNIGGRVDDIWRWVTAALAMGEPQVPARRVRALAWGGLVGIVYDHQRAIAYGAEAVERARELEDDAALALATILHGSGIIDFQHRTEETIAIFAESMRAFEAVGDEWSLGMAALLRGATCLLNSDLDAALPQLREAATRFLEIGNAWGRGVVLRHIADIATTRGRYVDAELALREAISGYRAIGVVGISGNPTARLAYVYALQERYEAADRWFEEALDSAEHQRYVPTLALAYNLRGIMLRRRNRLDEAEQCHRDALALHVDRAAPAGMSLSLASLGYIAELRGDAADAERHHAASLAAAGAAQDPRAQALALEGLAGVASLRAEIDAVGRNLGAAAALRDLMDVPLVRAERDDVERALARVADPHALATAYAEGYADPQAAIAGAPAES